MNDIHIPSPCRLTNTQCIFQWVSKSRVTPESYHSTLSLSDNHDRVSSLGNRTFGHLRGSLTPIQKFRISPRVSYTHTEILDISIGLLHQHINSGYLHGSLTPTQKFWISPRVSFTHSEILDTTAGLLHPNSRLFT